LPFFFRLNPEPLGASSKAVANVLPFLTPQNTIQTFFEKKTTARSNLVAVKQMQEQKKSVL